MYTFGILQFFVSEACIIFVNIWRIKYVVAVVNFEVGTLLMNINIILLSYYVFYLILAFWIAEHGVGLVRVDVGVVGIEIEGANLVAIKVVVVEAPASDGLEAEEVGVVGRVVFVAVTSLCHFHHVLASGLGTIEDDGTAVGVFFGKYAFLCHCDTLVAVALPFNNRIVPYVKIWILQPVLWIRPILLAINEEESNYTDNKNLMQNIFH